MKRSIMIAGHATSISLEPEFWTALKEIAAARNLSLAALVAELDNAREENTAQQGHQQGNQQGLSSYLRVYVLGWLKSHPNG